MHKNHFYYRHPFSELINNKDEERIFSQFEWLTLNLMLLGYKNTTISKILNRKVNTIKGYNRRIYILMGTNNLDELRVYAIKNGFFFSEFYL